MIVGLIADAHANVFGLRAALEALEEQGATEILFAGDAIGYHRYVNETIDLLRSADVRGVRGNHEAMLLGEIATTSEARSNYALDYADAVLREENRAWLEQLPVTFEVSIGGLRFSVFHGSPWQPLTEYVYPDHTMFERFATLAPGVVVLGHTHRQLERREGEVTIVNPGSVGLPRDGDERASYALVDTTTGAIVHGRASYDREALREATQPE